VPDLPRPSWCDLWARECDRVRKTHHWLDPNPITRPPVWYRTLIDGRWELYDERSACGPVVYAWRGRVRPFASDLSEDDLWKLIDDLDSTRRPPIGIREDGSLAHLEDCQADHAVRGELRDALTPLPALDAEYLVEIAYQASPAHPVPRSLEPRITRAEYPDMPHPLRDRCGLCVSYPPETRWTFERDGAALFADHTILYLARHTLWCQLRGKVKDPWLGVWASHAPREMLKALPTDPCQCSTGIQFGLCCRPRIAAQVEAEQAVLAHAIATTELAWIDAQLLALGAPPSALLFALEDDLLERGKLVLKAMTTTRSPW